jgi:hypothetical protein
MLKMINYFYLGYVNLCAFHEKLVRIQVSAIGMKGGRLRPRIHESIPRLGGEGFPP